jgi:hypothetical protein
MGISGVSIDTLRYYMEMEPDSHVMVETLTEAKRGKPAPVQGRG